MSERGPFELNDIIINSNTGVIIALPERLYNLNECERLETVVTMLVERVRALERTSSNVDKLNVMFTKQRELQERLGTFDKTRTRVMLQHFIDRMLLAIHEEAVEIARETNSKSTLMPFGWKASTKADHAKCKEEIVDLWHFTMNLWLVLGGTADEFFATYLEKNRCNHQRQDAGY